MIKTLLNAGKIERKNMKVFLDMDGVLVDFLGGLHSVFKEDYDYDVYPYTLGKWNALDELRGGTVPFEIIDGACCERLWAKLNWMHDGIRIYEAVISNFDDVTLLTTPMPNPGSWTGKYLWVKEVLGPCMAKKMIITSGSKSVVAGPDTCLIDDRDKNVKDFGEAGGSAILVPRPWNCMHDLRHKTYEVVEQSIKALKMMEKT